MLGFEGKEPTRHLEDVLQETGARSVILFARNIDSALQARDLIRGIRGLVPWPLLVAVDQEGGAVARITEGATVFPGNMALGATRSAELARCQGAESGRQLRAIGFDLNLAPVVDLQTNPANPGIGIRSLGASRAEAVPLARALIEGHAASGVASCLKHFPGKGAASVDAHLDLPILDLPLGAFRDPHLAIFEDLLGTTDRLAVMTTHVVVTGIDADRPATLSPRVVHDLLRRELGFDGLVIADDLQMGAIVKHWGIGEAAVEAARAGHDVVPICHDAEGQLGAAAALEGALADGRLDPADHAAAIARIERSAGASPEAELIDPSTGDEVARQIARRAVHLFADRRALLPLGAAQRVLVLAVRPHAVVGAEEAAEQDWRGTVAGCMQRAGLGSVHVEETEAELDPRTAELLLQRGRSYERVVLFTWNARGIPRQRSLLDRACRTLGDRLIVVHLRNPFDQALVPEEVTALTAFGYRISQIEALAGVLAGQLEPAGRLPAPVR